MSLSYRARIILIASVFASPAAAAHESTTPRVFLYDGAQMLKVRRQIQPGSTQFEPALKRLRRDARRAMDDGPFSVVNKDATPPSGDKHDYMSLAPYWWPNEDTSDGLPYVRRDGRRNPEIYKVPNRRDLGEMSDTVETLALAYFFTGNEKCAKRARKLIRVWFLERDTRMNPNFEFAQAIRGLNTGRGIGLIESRLFTKVVDAVGLLGESESWTADDQRGLEQWFAEFLRWMLESEMGRDEASQLNNHGTYYDVQVASFALFLGNEELARQVIESARTKRIAVQIEPDGRQPLELERTNAWGYSIGNLSGLMSLARLGEHVDVDLWNYQTADGRSIRAALEFLIPYGTREREWPYQQIGGFDAGAIDSLLRRAAPKFVDGPRALNLKVPATDPDSRTNLLQPPATVAPRVRR
jgi:hypothetical protein